MSDVRLDLQWSVETFRGLTSICLATRVDVKSRKREVAMQGVCLVLTQANRSCGTELVVEHQMNLKILHEVEVESNMKQKVQIVMDGMVLGCTCAR